MPERPRWRPAKSTRTRVRGTGFSPSVSDSLLRKETSNLSHGTVATKRRRKKGGRLGARARVEHLAQQGSLQSFSAGSDATPVQGLDRCDQALQLDGRRPFHIKQVCNGDTREQDFSWRYFDCAISSMAS